MFPLSVKRNILLEFLDSAADKVDYLITTI